MTDHITWTNDTRKLSDLVPWEHNPKRMTKKQADGLRLSIERFGFAVPFLVSPTGDIYDGHQRQALMNAIREYGPSATVDVRVSSRPLTDDERRELVVRLKQNQAGWDFDMLPNLYEKEELIEWGFEPEELGMFQDEPQGEDPGAQVDKAEELRVKWDVQPGQLWALGEHRLICGDCTDAAVVDRVMGGERARLVVSDPPYNVAYSSLGSNNDSWGEIENDDMSEEEFYGWLLLVGAAFDYAMASGASIYLCHGDTDRKAVPFIDLFGDMKWKRSATIIWAKQAASMGWQDYRSQHECLSYGWKEGDKHYFTADRSQTTVWEISRDAQAKYQHPTQKPVELFEKAISNSSEAGNVVVDFFLGSGTTLIACERLGRKCRAVEIEPGYVAVALQRFYDMTGIEPVLLEPGNSDLTVISNG